MKALYTLITFCLISFSASAQQVAKSQIIGNWEITAMGEEGALADFDSGEVTVTEEWKKKNPGQDVAALKQKLKQNIEEGGAMGRFGLGISDDGKVALQMGGEVMAEGPYTLEERNGKTIFMGEPMGADVMEVTMLPDGKMKWFITGENTVLIFKKV